MALKDDVGLGWRDEAAESGVIELIDDSGADMRSAGVSVDITGDTDMLSLMGLSVSMLRSAGS